MRRALALCLVLAAATACSGSKHKDTTAEAGTTHTPTTAATTASGATPGATASAGSSAAPGASAGTTAAPGTSAAPGSGSPASSRTGGATSTPPGTYTYDASGTQTALGSTQDVNTTSTLDLTAVIDGSQTSTQKNSQGTTEQHLLPRSNGTLLASLKISSPAFTKEFDFSPPALLLPVPAPVGKTWSWSGTSTDGKTTAKASNKVVRTETLTVGGEKVATVVLQSHLVISGDVSYTADITTWVATSLRLPVKDHTVGKGSTGIGQFSFDVTDVLRSVHPA